MNTPASKGPQASPSRERTTPRRGAYLSSIRAHFDRPRILRVGKRRFRIMPTCAPPAEQATSAKVALLGASFLVAAGALGVLVLLAALDATSGEAWRNAGPVQIVAALLLAVVVPVCALVSGGLVLLEAAFRGRLVSEEARG